jgi:hypothetical protein
MAYAFLRGIALVIGQIGSAKLAGLRRKKPVLLFRIARNAQLDDALAQKLVFSG